MIKKTIFKYVIFVAAAIILLSVGKDIIVKISVERGVEFITGLKLSMGGFRIGVIDPAVDIRNLRLNNPAGFKDPVMADMPEIYMAYDLIPAFKGEIHIRKARLYLKELLVVRDEKGFLNLDSLKVVRAEKDGKKPQETGRKAVKFSIDSLELKIGRAVYKDYSRGGAPVVKVYDLNIDEKLERLGDPYSVVSVIVVRALARTNVASLANFDLEGLSHTVTAPLANVKATVDTAISAAKDKVKETTGALAGMLSGPFGSEKK